MVVLICCFASSGTGNLQRVESKIDSLKHHEILEENVMPSVSIQATIQATGQ